MMKYLKLLDALRRSIDERKHIMMVHANVHTWDNVGKLDKGEVVRKGHLIGIVVRQKSAEHDGLVAFADASKKCWYRVLSYCPYLHELAYDGSCGLVTDAVNKDDGMANQNVIDELRKAKEEADRNRSIAMPPANQYSFPVFDLCKCSAENAYLPAINELLLLTDDLGLFGKYVRLEKELANVDIKDMDGICKIWSSTDSQHRYSDDDINHYYSDAFAVKIDNDGPPETIFLRKSEEAWCIPFCRF